MLLEKNNTMSIAMYPWFALSHLTSFLRLGNKLAERGHKISLFIPTKTQPKLTPYNHHPHLITFIPINVPHVDGLPAGAETTNDVEASKRYLIATAMDLTRDMTDSHMSRLKPDYVLFDYAYWIPALARKHGAKSVYYNISTLVQFAYFNSRARNTPDYHVWTAEELMVPPPGFPSSEMRLRFGEARTMSYGMRAKYGDGITVSDRLGTSLGECDAVVTKTCREVEGAFYDFLQKQNYIGKPLLLAGPIVPEPPASVLETHFDEWLKVFDKDSVIYCALGSECFLIKDLFHELLLGLELTGMPFLAALRPPVECDTIESALPEGFLERTKGRGIVHGGWVQQPLILEHPSVGCFVTHSGISSLAEAILTDCQLVLLPQAVDQFLNARLMSIYLKVGVEVERREDDNFFTREAVCKAISTVMEVESGIAKEVKENHAKLRNVLLKEGLEDSYIDGFIQSLRDLQ